MNFQTNEKIEGNRNKFQRIATVLVLVAVLGFGVIETVLAADSVAPPPNSNIMPPPINPGQIQKVEPKQNLSVKVSTNKSKYSVGETVRISIKISGMSQKYRARCNLSINQMDLFTGRIYDMGNYSVTTTARLVGNNQLRLNCESVNGIKASDATGFSVAGSGGSNNNNTNNNNGSTVEGNKVCTQMGVIKICFRTSGSSSSNTGQTGQTGQPGITPNSQQLTTLPPFPGIGMEDFGQSMGGQGNLSLGTVQNTGPSLAPNGFQNVRLGTRLPLMLTGLNANTNMTVKLAEQQPNGLWYVTDASGIHPTGQLTANWQANSRGTFHIIAWVDYNFNGLVDLGELTVPWLTIQVQ